MKQIAKSLILFSMISPLTIAGELVLSNGDRLTGDFVKLQNGKLHWQSDKLGQVTVNTSEVVSVSTNMAFKLDGHAEPCYWLSMDEGALEFACEDGAEGIVDVMSLNMVIPHDQYINGDRTYRGKLTVSGRRASGNREEKIWMVDSETFFRRGDFRHETIIEYDSISQYDLPTQGRGRVDYSLDWFLQEKWFWYNSVRTSFDEPASIKERYSYGTGLGYQVWETSTSALSLETGMDYMKERFTPPDSPSAEFEPDNTRAAWRWAVDFRYTLPRNAKLFHRHQLVRSLEESSDWVLETETGISMPLAGRLYSEIKFEYDTDNQPVEGNRREDKQVTMGVGYSW
ncbi:DUF481 domain-containing protein [Gilvimarinus sp. F26214L]|uniref:DUF481 domain-containing protein n=1 Tax=Gilvimarinus sp. DZF01 TaxID=3461371 RepID=UPI0040456C7D